MTYIAKITLKYDSSWEQTSGIYDEEMIPEEHITFECPAEDLNTIQLFGLFNKFLYAMGHSEAGIAKGAAYVAFNEMRSTESMRKTAEEYDLKLVEDYSKEICDLKAEILHLKKTNLDLNAKLSRALQPDCEQYTDAEMEAMTAEEEEQNRLKMLDKLEYASVVCHDCGKKYGEYSVGCSSTWEGKCHVCGEQKGVTETRDYGWLKKGIEELSK